MTLTANRRNVVGLGVVAVLLVAGGILLQLAIGRTCACGPSSPIDGVVTQVDATGLTDVQGFTLRIAGGSLVMFTLGPLENPTQFSPGHLKEHQASGSPIRVYFRTTGQTLTVYRLEDAPAATASP